MFQVLLFRIWGKTYRHLPTGTDGRELELSLVLGYAKRYARTDYVLEGVVMLQANQGDAGLIFRENDPGPSLDQMHGYYVGFNTKTLLLGKMKNQWQPLATYDLGKLDCKVVPGVWNQIRVAVQGPRIRVWFNRMHPSADKDAGLRIDVTDQNEPVLAGKVGVRTAHINACFDNIVVLPIDALPEPAK